MSDRWVLASDPREGEWPERMPSYCPHGVDENEADCGKCVADQIDAQLAANRPHVTMTDAEMTEAFAAFFRQALDKIREH